MPPNSSSELRTALAGVRAVILDADGVLLSAGRPLPGSIEALDRLAAAVIPYRVVTNYSLAHRSTLAASVSRRFGRPIDPATIITAASAAAAHTARHHPGERLFVLASDDARREWAGQQVVTADEADAGPEPVGAVVIGDAGDALGFANLDIAFRAVHAGAAFIAMHRNPWWITERGMTLDSGALVIGLEHALGRRATVTGKPSPVVFREAVRELAREARAPRLRRSEVVMVGDDLAVDIGGAQRIGLRAVLALSGKTTAEQLDATAGGRRGRSARPDAVAAGVLDVIRALADARSGPAGDRSSPPDPAR